jgi:hypothetical protein
MMIAPAATPAPMTDTVIVSVLVQLVGAKVGANVLVGSKVGANEIVGA